MVRHAEQAVGIGRQVDASDFRALVADYIQKARVLMSETVVILAPD